MPNKTKYTCKEGFKLEANQSITCMYNGHWSTPPQCSPMETTTIKDKSQSTSNSSYSPRSQSETEPIDEIITGSTAISTIHFLVVVLLLFLLVILFVALAVRYRFKFKRAKRDHKDMLLDEEQEENMGLEVSPPLNRKRPFDATIFYHFDTDDCFVINHLLPELEETRNFKLCIHSRNFVPGRDIKDNIEEAIEGSNSAIIVMS